MKIFSLILLLILSQIAFATTPIYDIQIKEEKLNINEAKKLGFEFSTYKVNEEKLTLFIGSPLFIDQYKSSRFKISYYKNNEYVAEDVEIKGQNINHLIDGKNTKYVSHQIIINPKYINKIEIVNDYDLDTGSNYKSESKLYIITINVNDF